MFQSKAAHKRTYLVQVKNKVSAESLHRLRTGVVIRIKGGENYLTPPCDVNIIERPKDLFPPPYQENAYLTTTWLRITLTEGKFHQVRKMTNAVRHRCMRLIRESIEDLNLGPLLPSKVQEVEEHYFFQKLKL